MIMALFIYVISVFYFWGYSSYTFLLRLWRYMILWSVSVWLSCCNNLRASVVPNISMWDYEYNLLKKRVCTILLASFLSFSFSSTHTILTQMYNAIIFPDFCYIKSPSRYDRIQNFYCFFSWVQSKVIYCLNAVALQSSDYILDTLIRSNSVVVLVHITTFKHVFWCVLT